jgi:glutathione S-transferase
MDEKIILGYGISSSLINLIIIEKDITIEIINEKQQLDPILYIDNLVIPYYSIIIDYLENRAYYPPLIPQSPTGILISLYFIDIFIHLIDDFLAEENHKKRKEKLNNIFHMINNLIQRSKYVLGDEIKIVDLLIASFLIELVKKNISLNNIHIELQTVKFIKNLINLPSVKKVINL